MKIGFNGLNRCFDFGLIGSFRPKQTQADSLDPSRPFIPFGTEAGLLGLSGGCGGGREALPLYGEGLGGSLVAQNLVDEGGDVA